MRAFYERWAQKEMSTDYELREKTLKWKANIFAKLIPKDQGFRTLLEVGCAEGFLINELRRLLKVDFAVGLDISKHFLNFGKERYPAIQFIQNDGFLPFKDKSFDLTICSDFIEHVWQISEYLDEIRRVSNFILFKIPVESCVIGNFFRATGIYPKCGENHPSGHLHLFSKTSAQEIIKKHGFSVINLSFEITPFTILYHHVPKIRIYLNPLTYLGILSRGAFQGYYLPLLGGNLFAYARSEE
jgi:hypothetical protein